MNSHQVTHTDRDSLISPDGNRRMFDAIARRYDLMNRILSMGLDRRWRRKAVGVLAPRAGGHYLDIGCGTGDMAIEILRQCPEAGDGVGFFGHQVSGGVEDELLPRAVTRRAVA